MTEVRGVTRDNPPQFKSIARRLELAFASVAAMTVVASGVAIWAFAAVEKTFVSVADRGFPQATAALRLKSDSQEFALALLALTSASDESTRAGLKQRMTLIGGNLRERIASLTKGLEVVDPLIAQMPELLEANVAETDQLVRQRLTLEGQAQELLARTAVAQRDFLSTLEPLETTANADLLAAARRTSLQAAASIHGLMDMEIASLRTLLKLRADALRFSSSLVEAQFPGRQANDGTLSRQGLALLDEVKRSVGQLQIAEAAPVGRALAAALGTYLGEDKVGTAALASAARAPGTNGDSGKSIEAALSVFDKSLEPVIRKMTFQMISQSDAITGNAANAVVLLVAEEVASLSAILRVRGEGSLLASLITQATEAGADRLGELQAAFDATQGRLRVALESAPKPVAVRADHPSLSKVATPPVLTKVKASSDLNATRAAFQRLAALGAGEKGIFALRAQQLRLRANVAQAVLRNQEVTSRFAAQVSDLSDGVGNQLAAQIGGLRFTLDRDTLLLVALAALSLLLSALVGWLYVGRGIAARLTRLADSMSEIAAGNFAAPIPSGQSDEISSMAESLRYFRDRIAAQREIERSAVNAAEGANKAKSDFLAGMSHELRTPLNAVIGFSEVLQERLFGELNAKQSEYVDDIHSSGKHLLSLINDILDLSKVEAGSMELELASFSVSTLVDYALTLIRERAAHHGITLEFSESPDLPDITADERKFKQILLNLLSNAVKFTPDGGRVSVAARRVGAAVEVSVSDTGIGIAPQDLEAVFDKFRQVGRASLAKAEGTGLGLALARQFVELHGGKIWVTSEPGKGSTFTFSLPARAPTDRTEENADRVPGAE